MRKKTKKIQSDLVEQVRKGLAGVSPQSKEMSKKQAVESMKKELRAARARGMTWQEIRDFFSNSGLEISISTLREGTGEEKKVPVAAKKPASVPAALGEQPKTATAFNPGHFTIQPDRTSY